MIPVSKKGVFVFLLLLSVLSVGAYCNETRVHTYAFNSSDHNTTIVRACTEEFDNASMTYLAFVHFLIFLILGALMYYVKSDLLKGVLVLPVMLNLGSAINAIRLYVSLVTPSVLGMTTFLDWVYILVMYLLMPLSFLLFAWCLIKLFLEFKDFIKNKKYGDNDEW